MALVIVLTIVALLTITVMEFTYNVQLDRHRTRNSLDAMQAKLLARSGINLAETFLAQDQDEKYDAFNEEWALALAEFCAGIELEPTMRLRCSWEDESGKINVNLTRPRGNLNPNQVSPDAIYRDALETIFQVADVDVKEIGTQLNDYWASPLPGSENENDKVPDFGSLEDFAAFFRIPPGKLGKLRRWLTAQPANRVTKINVNTAPEEVLYAILVGYGTEGGQEAAQAILDQREQDPPITDAAALIRAVGGIDEKVRGVILGRILDVKSSHFRLQASGLTNADPTGETLNGIGQTLSVLVRRTRKANLRGQDDGRINWTFRRLDWQKEAGARLFHERDSGLFGSDDETDEDETDEDDGGFSDRF